MPLNADNWETIGVSKPEKMIVMPTNNSGIQVGYMCHQYPKRIGWLIGPGGWRKPPSWMPYALDNGAFSAWKEKEEWDEHAYIALLEKARRATYPLWAAVPDVVCDREATIAKWPKWSQKIREILPHTPLAFVVQDGMTPADVPADAEVIFVGGGDDFKWQTLRTWTANFPRVHVGRVNSERKLWQCDDAGAESCDGTGWTMGGEDRLDELKHYLEISSGQGRPQMVMEHILQ